MKYTARFGRILSVGILGFAVLLHAQPQAALTLEGVSLELSVSSRVMLGDAIPVKLTLLNRGARAAIVMPLNVAELEFAAKPPQGDALSGVIYGSSVAVQRSPDLIEYQGVDRKTITLGPGQRVTQTFALAQVLHRQIHPSTYELSVTYEGKLTATQPLTVAFDGDRSVERLVSMMESASSSSDERYWAAHVLHALFYPVLDEASRKRLLFESTAPLQQVRPAASEFRKWYQSNRAQVRMSTDGQFVRREPQKQ